MKKLTGLLAVVALGAGIALVGCGSDDDTEPKDNGGAAGKSGGAGGKSGGSNAGKSGGGAAGEIEPGPAGSGGTAGSEDNAGSGGTGAVAGDSLGGAAGTLAAFREKGLEIRKAIGEELGLETAPTWHSARDAFARLGAEAAILTGLAAKVARDVALLSQPEVGEAAEPALAGRGGSSSMPHKRNPAGCLLALEAAARAPGLAATLLGELAPEHERGLGQWQSQWLTLRELTGACASALAATGEVLEGLEVDPEAMAANLARMNGLVFSEAVALRVSRAAADRLCAQALREGRNLLEVARADADVKKHLEKAELEALFEPRSQFGAAGSAIERVLADWATARGSAA